MGKADQGFIVRWPTRHPFGRPPSYNGFGGAGLQVRDALHVDDLYRLIRDQVAQMPIHREKPSMWAGAPSAACRWWS
jgi:CDP-paratose 2-epimerase